jgi:hypothetical protein
LYIRAVRQKNLDLGDVMSLSIEIWKQHYAICAKEIFKDTENIRAAFRAAAPAILNVGGMVLYSTGVMAIVNGLASDPSDPSDWIIRVLAVGAAYIGAVIMFEGLNRIDRKYFSPPPHP